jgi:DNA-binding CsgD family transcriptional regulator
LIELQYVNENRPYQRVLDLHYHGTVIAIDRFLNGKSSILHYCLKCSQTFYNAPNYLLLTNRHVCGADRTSKHKSSTSSNKLNKKQREEVLQLFREGQTISQIAKLFYVRPTQVRYQLKKNGLY